MQLSCLSVFGLCCSGDIVNLSTVLAFFLFFLFLLLECFIFKNKNDIWLKPQHYQLVLLR